MTRLRLGRQPCGGTCGTCRQMARSTRAATVLSGSSNPTRANGWAWRQQADGLDRVGGRFVGADGNTAPGVKEGTLFSILVALSFAHLLNDLIQSLIPAIYPILKASFDLSFTQIGLITL